MRAVISAPDIRHVKNPTAAVSNETNRKSQPEQRFNERIVREIFARTCAHAKVSNEAALKIETLCEHLVRAGTTTNLSGTRTFEDALIVHAVDSLSLLPTLDRAVDENNKLHLVDVGSGAGFPGFAIAVARERWSVALVEATRKKVNYQQDAIQDVQIGNVKPIWGRAETLDDGHRALYDACVARAVARMVTLAEISLPLVRVGGLFIAQKSLDATQRELREAENALRKLGGEIVDVRQAWTERIIGDVVRENGVEVARNDEREKSLVVVKKISDTPHFYPRSHSAMKNKPL